MEGVTRCLVLHLEVLLWDSEFFIKEQFISLGYLVQWLQASLEPVANWCSYSSRSGGGGLLPPSHALKSNLSQPADLLTGNNVFQEVADWSSSCHSKYPRLPVQTAD